MARSDFSRASLAILALLGVGFAATARADIVQADDVIIDGSLCVGVSCADGEAFGTGTVRLKSGSVRIDLIDTSGSGVADRDWRIEANAAAGVAEFFAIKDMGDSSTGAEGGTAIMTLRAGAPANSLYVNAGGRVGFGTATPTGDLHILDEDTPRITLEQGADGGLANQAWDLSANESSFSLQDRNASGSRVPFQVAVGAPNYTLRAASDGRVGVNAFTPLAPMEIRNTPTNIGTGNAVLKLVNPSGPTAFQLQPFGTGFFWNFAASDNDTFNVNRSGNGTVEMSLNGAGNLTISGTLTTGGPSCSTGCDAVFDADYDLPTIEDHAEAMWAQKHLPNVGPTLPNQPVNISEQYGRMLNELETAHIYIEQLHREKLELRAELEAQRVANEDRFTRLEIAISGKLVE